MPRSLRFVLFACVLASLAPALPVRAQSRGSLFPQTTGNVHLEMVFNYDQQDLTQETGPVDLVWGSSYPTEPAGMYNSAYIPYSVDNFTYPVSWYRKNHPDWLEYHCDRKTLAYEFGNASHAPLDFSNPEVQQFQWSNWVDAPLSQGYAGIAVDTMSLTNNWARCGHFSAAGKWVQQYAGKPTDARFRRDELAWEAATYQHVQQYSATATMQVNVSYQFGQSDADNLQLMTTADLLFDERGFTNWGDGDPVTPSEWTGILKALLYVQSKGLCYTTNGEEPSQTSQITQAQRLWVVANYLLVRNDCTYMYISGFNGQQQDYGRLILFPEYAIDIGQPTAAMEKTHGVWERPYSNGLTLVNASSKAQIVKLPPGSWVDVNGNLVGPTVTLPQQTGQVLLVGK
jgi:Hypothetical glycosyl hydrolase family 15